MVELFLIISFLLHLVTLFVIYQLLQKVQKLENETKPVEIIEALENSLQEIKKENERLQTIMTTDSKKQEEELQRTVNHTPEVIRFSEKESTAPGIDHLIGTSPGYEVEASLESKVLQLHAKGLSLDEIAKQLDCGKTEADLIIKFHGK